MPLRLSHAASSVSLTSQSALTTSVSPQATTWNSYEVTAVASTASASTISTASALSGPTKERKTSKSLTTTDLLPPVKPGEILLEDFLKPLGISQYKLARAISVPETRINAIVRGTRAITADTDLRLCRFFGLSTGYWLRAQMHHDIEVATRQIGADLMLIKPIGTRNSAS
jgi:addiction module HigA family antidote